MPPPASTRTLLRLVRAPHRLPILHHLRLEEAALRAAPPHSAWAFVTDGVEAPALVLGVSGKPEEQCDLGAAAAAGVPIIRRFSGGGGVVVDGDSLLVGLSGPAATVVGGGGGAEGAACPPSLGPRALMAWTEGVYGPVFSGVGPFALRENDYVFGDLKFGGNAQAISKGRWVHHTSFLWDFTPARMAMLTQPSRAPAYRAGRPHGTFVTSLRAAGAGDRAGLLSALPAALEEAGFTVVPTSLEEAEDELLGRPHHRSTRVLVDGSGRAVEEGGA